MLIVDYYLVRRRRVAFEELYTLRPDGSYHYRSGVNPVAVAATIVGAVAALALVLLGSTDAASFSWFVGAGVAAVVQYAASPRVAPPAAAPGWPWPSRSYLLHVHR